jgi:hypothetical protein
MADRQPIAHLCGNMYGVGSALDKPSVSRPRHPCRDYCLCTRPKGHGSDHHCSDCGREWKHARVAHTAQCRDQSGSGDASDHGSAPGDAERQATSLG